MSEVTSHAPGNFCWIELATTDSGAAKNFYLNLFGWTTNEIPMGDQGAYVMLLKDGKEVGALYQMMPEQGAMPPNWQTYVAVAHIDESVERAKSLGANVIAGPFDVYDSGRMAVLTDPVGAVIALWQAKEHIGYRLQGEPGSVCWSELSTKDIAGARTFYGSLFGWTWKEGGDYTEWQHDGRSIGGAMPPPDPSIPPHWMPYFAVEDADATVAKAQSLGGQTVVPPTDIEHVGRFSVIADPQGAMFSVIRLG